MNDTFITINCVAVSVQGLLRKSYIVKDGGYDNAGGIRIVDILYAIQQQQLQETYGELKALLALHYDPIKGNTDEKYAELDEMIERFINGLRDLIG